MRKKPFKVIAAAGALTAAVLLVGCGTPPASYPADANPSTPTSSATPTVQRAKTETAETVPVETVKIDDGVTNSQKQAVRKAKSYLDFQGFSQTGLIKQLEFEGFTNEEATYAVNTITVDWDVQAEKKAKSYLDFQGFSRSGLIKQLEFEGFTPEQAAHGATKAGL